MKVLVIGATGATGRHLVAKLLARGVEVTAFARNPDAITERHERLRVAKGDARDAASLERAMEGQDAVISAFGPRSLKKDDLQETLMRNLIAAMRARGVKRLVNLSAWGAGDSAKDATLPMKIFMGLLLKNVFADKNRGEALLAASDLDYVNVRPGRLTNGARRGGVQASLEPRGLAPWLTREDLAEFMIAQLDSGVWLRKSPLVSY